jgi:hypothetical protein
MVVAALVVAAPAKASVSVQDATMAPPMVTIVMSRSEISAADDVLGQPVTSCVRDDKNIAPMDSPVLPWIAVNAPRVHLTGSIETKPTDGVVSTTKPYWCTHYGESVAPSWPTLQLWASKYGMKFISHSADYPQVWGSVPPNWVDPYAGKYGSTLADWQNWETCGSRDDIVNHGLLGALGQYNWPNQHTDPTVMAADVQQCFYMNRSYKGTSWINTLSSVEANQDIATTRQLLGGPCSEVDQPSAPCRSVLPTATWYYTPPRQVINLIKNLQPGQALNLQAYVLVRNSNPDVTTGVNQYKTNADQWDCTNPNPAYHWSNDAERYCWVDFQRIIKAIQDNPNVVVTDPEGVAQTWGMSRPIR